MLPLLQLREEVPPTVDGRTLTARICTYDRVYQPTPTLRERIRPGAFRGPIARPAGVLRYRHAGERPGDGDDLSNVHGLVTALREEGGAVLADVHVWEGSDGDKILRLVESEAITGVSMSAVFADSARGRDGVLDVTRISHVNGISLTPTPAYDDAAVLREQAAARRAAAEVEARANAAMREWLDGGRYSGPRPARRPAP